MKILYDHLCFWQKYGGVPRYFVELMKRMPKDMYINTVKYSSNEYLKELPQIHYHPFLGNLKFKRKARLESEFGKLFSIPYLLKGQFDIYHQTHYDPYAYKYLPKRIRTVTTIHDMNFYAIPEFYNRFILLKIHMKTSIRKADKIITVSNNSKKDICNYLNVPSEKVSVIYHGIDLEKFGKESIFKPTTYPYILYVGTREKYKNFDNMLNAFSLLKAKYPDLWLYCAGTYPLKTEMEMLVKYKIDHAVKFIQATDDELISLYKNAQLFVFPSYYEGFGLPILEAMAAKCPMALSNTSCFPEIARGAASYFDPYDIDSMVDSMEHILSDDLYKQKIVAEGTERVKHFSWEECVMKHLELYKNLLQ